MIIRTDRHNRKYLNSGIEFKFRNDSTIATTELSKVKVTNTGGRL